PVGTAQVGEAGIPGRRIHLEQMSANGGARVHLLCKPSRPRRRSAQSAGQALYREVGDARCCCCAASQTAVHSYVRPDQSGNRCVLDTVGTWSGSTDRRVAHARRVRQRASREDAGWLNATGHFRLHQCPLDLVAAAPVNYPLDTQGRLGERKPRSLLLAVLQPAGMYRVAIRRGLSWRRAVTWDTPPGGSWPCTLPSLRRRLASALLRCVYAEA